MDLLLSSVEYLKGIGTKRAELLSKYMNIFTFKDLMMTFPYRYIDRSRFYKVSELDESMQYIQLIGRFRNFKSYGDKRTTRMTAQFYDSTGGVIEVVWFNSFNYIKNYIRINEDYVVFGKPTLFNHQFQFSHPEITTVEEVKRDDFGVGLQPMYSIPEKAKAKGLDNRNIARAMRSMLIQLQRLIPETLNAELISRFNLLSREEAMFNIHFPTSNLLLKRAEARIKFEEFFFLQMKLNLSKINRQRAIRGHHFSVVGEKFNTFFHNYLPFELTNAQKRVVREIRLDMGSGKQMNRLLQGDVGSGKTLVALMSMLIAIDNGYQACIIAPTEILATQHFNSISKMISGMGLGIELLTGSTKVAHRRRIHEGLLNGNLNILVGTHAILEDKVVFKNLGLTVIDEQHRFGVGQRAKMWDKNVVPPHILVMTATPIPRTLAMTLYGDLDVSVIDELPPGRKSIVTKHFFDSSRLKMFGFIRQQIDEGRQVYFVYPLINESETLDLKHLMDGYESIIREFPLPKYAISIVHGKMKAEDKDYEMNRFKRGETQIMVSTTVIEVGVDVPNATVMVIENAERFGLSQLHQLRGRVGRGGAQSYCILMTDMKLSNDARVRIKAMTDSNDGFVISEIDLKLRGPGDISGQQQSGIMDFKLADIVRDEPILKAARISAIDLLEKDPRLQLPENRVIAVQYNTLYKDSKDWAMIS